MITFYTTHCPQCNALKTKLDKKQIQYEICDDKDLMLEKGFKAAPILEIDNQVYKFSEAIKWVNEQ